MRITEADDHACSLRSDDGIKGSVREKVTAGVSNLLYPVVIYRTHINPTAATRNEGKLIDQNGICEPGDSSMSLIVSAINWVQRRDNSRANALGVPQQTAVTRKRVTLSTHSDCASKC